MNTKPLANSLARRHGTRNPIHISKNLGYIVIDTPLSGINGYYQFIRRCNIVYLDSGLSHEERRWVCAHELGHSLLHSGLNRVFLDTGTHMVSSKFENEADRFAVDLLFSDDQLREYIDCSYDTVARCLGVSYSLAQYRMNSIRTF